MDDLKRIFNRFEDLHEFAGFGYKKAYGKEAREALNGCGIDADTMDKILYYQGISTDEAFLDGFKFGIKLLVECLS